MRVISVLNFKGGTGKSSVTENLGHAVAEEAVAEEGEDVLVIDGDRQRNASKTLLGEDGLTPTLADVMTGKATLAEAIRPSPGRPHLFVVPGDGDLEKVGTYLKEHRRSYYTVAKALAALKDRFAFVFIDHPGAYSVVMEALLLASDEILVPCELEPYSVQGLFDMYKKLGQELEDHTLGNTGIIPYNANYSRKMTRQYIQELQDEFGDLVTDPIATDINISYAQSEQMTIFEYERKYKIKGQAAKDIRALAARLREVVA